jgi:hypothetical protein
VARLAETCAIFIVDHFKSEAISDPIEADGGSAHWQLLPKSLSFGGLNEIKPMPTRNISLTSEQDAFIDEMLKAGQYRNASEKASPHSIAASSPKSRTRTWTPISTTLLRRTAVDSAWRDIGFPSRRKLISPRS